jgi:hypothetical protein
MKIITSIENYRMCVDKVLCNCSKKRQDEMHEKCSTFGEMTHTMIWSEILNRRDHCGQFKSKWIVNIKLGVEKPDKYEKFRSY